GQVPSPLARQLRVGPRRRVRHLRRVRSDGLARELLPRRERPDRRAQDRRDLGGPARGRHHASSGRRAMKRPVLLALIVAIIAVPAAAGVLIHALTSGSSASPVASGPSPGAYRGSEPPAGIRLPAF